MRIQDVDELYSGLGGKVQADMETEDKPVVTSEHKETAI